MGKMLPAGATPAGGGRERGPMTSPHFSDANATNPSNQTDSQASAQTSPRKAVVPAIRDVSPHSHINRTIPDAKLPPAKDTVQPDTNGQNQIPTGSLGRPTATIIHDDLFARSAGAHTTKADLNELESSAQERIVLPGISGIPVRLLHHPDTARAALRAAERVYDMSLRQLEIDDATREAQLANLHARSQKVIDNLFSGRQEANPDGALAAGIQALRNAATIYREMNEKTPTNDNGSYQPSHDNAPTIVDPAERMQTASTIINQTYPPEVAAKLMNAFEPFSGYKDSDFTDRCNDTTDAIHEQAGFVTEYGTFKLDKRTPKEIGSIISCPHAWSVDDQGRIVDFSVRQFNAYLKEPITDPVLIIDEDHPLRSRYKQDQF